MADPADPADAPTKGAKQGVDPPVRVTAGTGNRIATIAAVPEGPPSADRARGNGPDLIARRTAIGSAVMGIVHHPEPGHHAEAKGPEARAATALTGSGPAATPTPPTAPGQAPATAPTPIDRGAIRISPTVHGPAATQTAPAETATVPAPKTGPGGTSTARTTATVRLMVIGLAGMPIVRLMVIGPAGMPTVRLMVIGPAGMPTVRLTVIGPAGMPTVPVVLTVRLTVTGPAGMPTGPVVLTVRLMVTGPAGMPTGRIMATVRLTTTDRAGMENAPSEIAPTPTDHRGTATSRGARSRPQPANAQLDTAPAAIVAPSGSGHLASRVGPLTTDRAPTGTVTARPAVQPPTRRGSIVTGPTEIDPVMTMIASDRIARPTGKTPVGSPLIGRVARLSAATSAKASGRARRMPAPMTDRVLLSSPDLATGGRRRPALARNRTTDDPVRQLVTAAGIDGRTPGKVRRTPSACPNEGPAVVRKTLANPGRSCPNGRPPTCWTSRYGATFVA